MADNYLEKQYAEYEAKRAAWERVCKLGINTKKQVRKKTTETQTEKKREEEKR